MQNAFQIYRVSQQVLVKISKPRKIRIFYQKTRQIKGISALFSQNVNTLSRFFLSFVILKDFLLVGTPDTNYQSSLLAFWKFIGSIGSIQ